MKLVKRAHVVTYDGLLADVAHVIEAARHAAVRSVNAVMTITYWLIGGRIIEQEQRGAARAGYGEELLKRLARDLSERFGRGFSERNLEQMRAFYLGRPIPQTASAKLIDVSSEAAYSHFPLSWSHYARLLAVRNAHARTFYESESLRGGWTIRQLDRQIQSQFYERTALSRDKAALLGRGTRSQASDAITPDEQIKVPNLRSVILQRRSLLLGLTHLLQRLLLALGQRFCRCHRLPPSPRRIADERQLADSDHVGTDGVTGVNTFGEAA